ncbi:MAG: helix-hairpin-helix domain-containing protein [Thermodesulfobacteriota bacterium]
MRGKRILDDSGVALVLVLWITVLLSVIVGSFAMSMRTEARAVSNFMEGSKAYYLARAGFTRAVTELLKDKHLPPGEFQEEGWKVDGTVNTFSFDGGYAEVSVMDEGGKMDLNAATRGDLVRVFAALELDFDQRDVVADSILDWRDEDDVRMVNGAEDGYYMSLPRPYGAKDASFEAVDELIRVRGITGELFHGTGGDLRGDALDTGEPQRPGLEELFTVFTLSAGVNVNTASFTMLTSIPGIDELYAREIIDIRESDPFQGLEELMEVVPGLSPGAGSKLTFSSPEIYTIDAEGGLDGTPARRSFKAVIKIKGKSDYEILYWRDG